MLVTVNKIFLHGLEVMKHFLFPIGQYSEEAAEARNSLQKLSRVYKLQVLSLCHNHEFTNCKQIINKH